MNNKSVTYNVNKKLGKRKSRLTVCIAAINNGAVIGASDRMITAGDIEFEPPIPKILSLTTSIVVLTAGDQSIQMQVFQKAHKIIIEKIDAEPQKWIDVLYAAEVYSKCFYELRNKLIENHVLSPYNLTFDSFIVRQKEMDMTFIDMINNKIRIFINNLGGIETIITGIDSSVPHIDESSHIYVVTDGEISCHDKLGFASIGIGSNHALSHFMLSKYTTSVPPSKALLTIHQAKKKSEISPGVGKETDMFLIVGLGKFTMFDQLSKKDIIEDLDGFYKKYIEKIEDLNKKNEDEIADYFNKLMEQIPESDQRSSLSPSASASPSSSEAEPEPEEGD